MDKRTRRRHLARGDATTARPGQNVEGLGADADQVKAEAPGLAWIVRPGHWRRACSGAGPCRLAMPTKRRHCAEGMPLRPDLARMPKGWGLMLTR